MSDHAELRAEVERLEDFQNDIAQRMPPEFDGDEAQEYLIDHWIATLVTDNEQLEAALAEAQAEVARVKALRDEWADVGRHDKAAARAARKLDAALDGPDPEATEGYPCGHAERVKGCGGCDPGAVEYIRDDTDRVWRKTTKEDT